ncbi:alpha-amylase family glycosyl hydrolase [Algoriphagus sediminis]|uniref:1,4-alpha-glucan branching enzyme n=1 Tax=Algoriphagus sediminis TaxID=3057113 RepID=A0ABT7Y839_9BACT|nr:alpha amylase C-terminal domain-containing protein [Algoriphagus sediminis]MDN3202620.1 alpha amylase C-terminal domain-containing protein [Algoriphagus sediminis]
MSEAKSLQILQDEKWLQPFASEIKSRNNRYLGAMDHIRDQYGDILEYAGFHKYFGIHYEPWRKGWIYREWAPEAKQLYLMGDFNWWDRYSHPMKKNKRGEWEIFLDEKEYAGRFVHGSKVKVHVTGANDVALDRIPAYIRRVVQDEKSHDFAGQVWNPKPFKWSDKKFSPKKSFAEPFIYECHIGMAQEDPKVGTYKEFEEIILPRIVEAGYNVIQFMAIMEHPYYGSFGYHVSNFFAPTSRFGTPEELKSLIDKAHSLGIAVVMDIVHSHAVKNVNEGLNEFDGTPYQYFHPGEKGYHEGWDSKLFNYGKEEVQQFLLSNIRYWMEEFHFDGFRFDGVTSMIYEHHGHVSFGDAKAYFDEGVSDDTILYLQLANTLIHKVNPEAISIAEEVSGMPGLCRKIQDGGIGFDFRLAMGIPDFWIKTLKHKPDEQWDMFELWHELTNRPKNEKSIAYAESHDQALVGDKSIAFWLMDAEMYSSMSVLQESLVVDRGIALHKLIRMITISLGGEGYLNFIGNEFGHPEWVDFPREGNNWSYQYARRQWSLADTDHLRYSQLLLWDKEMIALIKTHNLFESPHASQLYLDPDKKILAYERGELVFVFSFNPTESLVGFKVKVPTKGKYKLILHSDEKKFGGFDRVETGMLYPTNKDSQLELYLPNRTVLIFKKD